MWLLVNAHHDVYPNERFDLLRCCMVPLPVWLLHLPLDHVVIGLIRQEVLVWRYCELVYWPRGLSEGVARRNAVKILRPLLTNKVSHICGTYIV